MKQRLEATHFIEVWCTKGEQPGSLSDSVLPISDLKPTIYHTARMNTLKTVAIWKIKFKN